MKQYLKLLTEKNFNEPTMSPIISGLMVNYDDDQLLFMFQTGVKISKDLSLFYQLGVGFRCYNENAHIVGNKPICGVIERSLNNQILNS